MKRALVIFTTVFLILFSLAACASNTTPAVAPEDVTMQLKWIHQAQFAGFYTAAEKGFYKDEKIDITLSPGGVGVDILDQVTSGRAQVGLIGAEKVIVAHAEGLQVKAFATTYRRNPFCLVSLPESNITKPEDFPGLDVSVGGTDGLVQFSALLSRLNIDINQIHITPYSYDLEPFF